MRYTWLTQGGFLFESSGTRLLIDPYMSDFIETHHHLTRLQPFPLMLEQLRPGWLVCTHDHLDHFDPPTVKAVSRFYPNCRFAGPQSCFEHFQECGIEPERCQLMDNETPMRCGVFELQATPAFHSDPHAVGLLINDKDHRVYLSGDSNFSLELANVDTCGADAVFICINGKLNNMNDMEALDVVKAIRPSLALPMHYGLFAENTTRPQAFIDSCLQFGIRSFEMTPGKEYEL